MINGEVTDIHNVYFIFNEESDFTYKIFIFAYLSIFPINVSN